MKLTKNDFGVQIVETLTQKLKRVVESGVETRGELYEVICLNSFEDGVITSFDPEQYLSIIRVRFPPSKGISIYSPLESYDPLEIRVRVAYFSSTSC